MHTIATKTRSLIRLPLEHTNRQTHPYTRSRYPDRQKKVTITGQKENIVRQKGRTRVRKKHQRSKRSKPLRMTGYGNGECMDYMNGGPSTPGRIKSHVGCARIR